MKNIFKQYLNNEIKYEKWQIIGIICLVIVLSGLFGWVYELIFYYFNSGMQTFYYRGSNFLPWINIYAVGSLLILITTSKVKKKPILVFLIAFIVTGLLEYLSGYFILKITGKRLWDYNTEILNFGNIDGFICLRSVTFFGMAALLLRYAMLPFCIYLSQKMPKKIFLIISVSLCSLVLVDKFYNFFLTKLFNLPSAVEIYEKIGIPIMKY